MYRAPRAIDVAMMAAATMAGRTAVGKRAIAAREGRSVGKTEDAPQTEMVTASRAAWARPVSPRACRCGRERLAGPSEAGRSVRAPPTAAPRALAAPLPLGASVNARSVTPAHSELSRAEGNSTFTLSLVRLEDR